jgi:hypothetical protein
MMKTQHVTQELVNKHFLPNTVAPTGWLMRLNFSSKEREHRGMIGVLEYLVGVANTGLVPTGFFGLEYAYEHKLGYSKHIGDFAVFIDGEKKVIIAGDSKQNITTF